MMTMGDSYFLFLAASEREMLVDVVLMRFFADVGDVAGVLFVVGEGPAGDEAAALRFGRVEGGWGVMGLGTGCNGVAVSCGRGMLVVSTGGVVDSG
jgi:hypothetical protein